MNDRNSSPDGGPFQCIPNVDELAPFLMNVVSNGNVWIFAGSNTGLTAGRRDPDCALFPYQTADKILGQPQSSGAMCLLRVGDSLWEPWAGNPRPSGVSRNLYKHECGTSVVFEETNHALGLRMRWRLEASDEFGLVRRCTLENIGSAPVSVRSLDGWHRLLPHGVNQETYARYSYLAAAYMRHEVVADVGLGIYTLNAAISDRATPAESLRVSCAWSLGHRRPVRLLSDHSVAAFRSGDAVREETEIRGDFGAYLVADEFSLAAGETHEWFTVADIGLDHGALVKLQRALKAPDELRRALVESCAANTRGLRWRVAAADGLQQTGDRAAGVHHFSNVMFNLMRGGTLDCGYECPRDDFAKFLRARSRPVFARHAEWVSSLPERTSLTTLAEQAAKRDDAQLRRLANEYLPLCFARRHGDPSRPWNRFSIETRDAEGRPKLGYSGNWRDIFQNWEALAQSYPACLGAMVAVFLNASTADGYNPYRLTRDGIDWEVHDPGDAWSHIGYWGDHQIIYLLRLLESHERFWPGMLSATLGERAFASACVPYEIAGFDALVADPKHSITFNTELHRSLVKRAAEIGGDGKLLSDAEGEVQLASLAEKLLVPALVKLSNLVPGGGIWLNTQRPEWNDANNALAGWGLSVVTVCHLRRYLVFLEGLLAKAGDALVFSAPVAELLATLTDVLRDCIVADDSARFAAMEKLGRAGETHRRKVYAGEFAAAVPVNVSALRELIAAALPVVDSTIHSNRRADGLAHSYNVLAIRGRSASVEHLDLMLEGQVAILSSGMLGGEDALALLEALRHSPLYREDQRSYILYPDREIVPFLQRNTLPADWRKRSPFLASLADAGDTSVVVIDANGAAHFQSDLSNAADMAPSLVACGAAERESVLALWEGVFHHSRFTGRSSTFFAFEGLGSIYWHMVAKLLLAVQELHADSRGTETARLRAAYTHVRDGLGFRKTPAEYGAFPTDAYSHTPKHTGAQQPGMTGQVKEEILTRLGELGVVVAAGCISFAPRLLDAEEFSEGASTFDCVNLASATNTVALPPRSLAFTLCQVPIVLSLGESRSIQIHRADGTPESIAGNTLSAAVSREIFHRTGNITSISVTTSLEL